MEMSMFFLGGMTMGYFAPPGRSDRRASALFRMARRDSKAKARKSSAGKNSAIEHSMIWAWHTIC